MNKAKLKKKLLGKKVSAFTMIEKEIAVMKKMAHPNICKLLEVIDDDT
jgi:[calcium/calmodulin-dependent protein kinase] kinase